jgi:citronellyl-CoA synthetase
MAGLNMNNKSGFREVFRVLGEARHILPAMTYKMPKFDDCNSLGLLFESTVSRYPDNVLLVSEGREWSYSQFNVEVNQLARTLQTNGVERGDAVAVLMETRAEFVLAFLALAKLGAEASLINNGLSGDGLIHCIKSTGSKKIIVGEERVSILAEMLNDLPLSLNKDYFWLRDSGAVKTPNWAIDLSAAYPMMPTGNLAVTQRIKAKEVAAYIFTSGTTGLPKAAIMNHRKILAAGHGLGRIGLRLTPEDRLYLCLPLYHITGLGPGFCGVISNGASIFLRRSFSASNFWSDVQENKTNCFIYVGELCRYLALQPECPQEKNNPLTKMLGNGLRPDVWDVFSSRFGVDRICEIYGSSEGNVTMANILNKDRTIGTPLVKADTVKYDVENDVILRDERGRCIKVATGEPGLLIGEITPKATFEGYTNSSASDGKILRDVFKKGDRWFNTGDLVREIDVGFALGLKHYQFVDRTGDTFRWRAENVSTNEVAEVLNKHPQIAMANVYGVEVPGVEGRAGMVAFEFSDASSFDIDALQSLVERDLPFYAQPVFIRIQKTTETTATFKLVKGALRKEAFHLDKIGGDHIYVRQPRSNKYELLSPDFYSDLLEERAGY